MDMKIGTSGIPPHFWESKYSKGKDCRLNMPFWIKDIGLNAYEVLYTYGARMREENALILKENVKKTDIWLTVHAAYYVVLTSPKEDVQERSVEELFKAIRLADIMDAHNVILHPGYNGDDSEKSYNRFVSNLKLVVKKMKEHGISKPKISPEIGGKKSQLGSLKDIIRICEDVEYTVPCIDWAHLHAREDGSLQNINRFNDIIINCESLFIIKEHKLNYYPFLMLEKK